MIESNKRESLIAYMECFDGFEEPERKEKLKEVVEDFNVLHGTEFEPEKEVNSYVELMSV